jgi:hypothetical protein
MTQTEVRIGYPLYNATKQALERLRKNLPPGALTRDPETSEKEFIDEWAAALIGVSLEAVLDAAGRWLRDPELVDGKGRTRIPQIASFAMYARKVDFDHWRPPLTLTEQTPRKLPGRVHELQIRAERSLGSRELAQEVWGVLLRGALPGEPSQAVREGRISDADFDVAIALVRESARAARKKVAS